MNGPKAAEVPEHHHDLRTPRLHPAGFTGEVRLHGLTLGGDRLALLAKPIGVVKKQEVTLDNSETVVSRLKLPASPRICDWS